MYYFKFGTRNNFLVSFDFLFSEFIHIIVLMNEMLTVNESDAFWSDLDIDVQVSWVNATIAGTCWDDIHLTNNISIKKGLERPFCLCLVSCWFPVKHKYAWKVICTKCFQKIK